ncbi:cyclophilin-like fold protein [Sporomusa aerivorans]|uniref:cyclophilin-like fold protein n=1 Tax=Sporomusa aerivorans TaxID=204936 RepID=UPI00352B2A9A
MKIKRKFLLILLVFTMSFGLSACASTQNEAKQQKPAESPGTEGKANASSSSSEAATPSGGNGEAKGIKVKITVGSQVLTATLIDNATTRNLISRFPLTLPMMDLYSREMCYRFSDVLPANEVQTSGYEVGDISYWTPRHSFVIFYKQNGEVIGNLQKIGHIDSGVEIFSRTGDTNVTFELLDK